MGDDQKPQDEAGSEGIMKWRAIPDEGKDAEGHAVRVKGIVDADAPAPDDAEADKPGPDDARRL